MNERCEDDSVLKKALIIGAIGYGIVNGKRVFSTDNLDIITDNLTRQRYNKIKELAIKDNSKLKNIVMKTQTPFNLHYSATRDDGAVNVLSPLKATLGLNYLRLSNDPVYRQASEVFNRKATNKDMLDYILAHEFGHQDHFTRNIGYDMSGINPRDGYNIFHRNRYKEQNPYEIHADDFARRILEGIVGH